MVISSSVMVNVLLRCFPAFIVVYASGFGITAGAHRLWSHRAYKAKWPLRLLLITLFTVAGQVRLHFIILFTVRGQVRLLLIVLFRVAGQVRLLLIVLFTVRGQVRLLLIVLFTVTGQVRLLLIVLFPVAGQVRLLLITLFTVTGQVRLLLIIRCGNVYSFISETSNINFLVLVFSLCNLLNSFTQFFKRVSRYYKITLLVMHCWVRTYFCYFILQFP